jgi:uncharacterized membrane protein YdjX (TVP38/TMEM64 family)
MLMRRYWTAVGFVLLFFLSIFLLAELISPDFLSNLYDRTELSSGGMALTGVVLLVADVILPVPSSLIMMANGAFFGIAMGTILSIAGTLGAAFIAFFIGRRGEPVLARFVPLEERTRANHLLNKWGWLAIIVTRSIPLLAETTLIMAGASSMQLRSMILATLAGTLPIAVLYAVIGATAAHFDHAFLAFGWVVLMTGLLWFVGRRMHKTLFKRNSSQDTGIS